MSVRNNVNLIGRLTKDVEVKKTSTGKSVASISLAVDSGRKDNSGNNITNFFNLVVWDKNADNMALYAHKGNLIAVEGELSSRTYSQDGKNRTVTEVIVHEWLNLSPKQGSTSVATPSQEEDLLETYNYMSEPDF